MDTVVRLLQAHGLAAEGQARVVWHQRLRHTTTLVSAGARSWLVKQRGAPLITESVSLEAEALFYRWLAANRTPDELASCIPTLEHAFAQDSVLVFEGFPSHTTASACLRIGFVDTEMMPDRIGRALGRLHSMTGAAAPGELPEVRNPVSIYTTCTPEMLVNRPGSFRELLRLLQIDPTLATRLQELRDSWSPRALIHGDLRLDNILVPLDASSSAGPLIVDWEFAGIGDPRWDGATLIGSYLWTMTEAWLLDPGECDTAERYQEVREAIDRFRSSYETTRSDDPLFEAEREGEDVLVWAGYWLIHRLVVTMAMRRSLTAFDAAIVRLASELLLDDESEGDHVAEY
jgi:hypothetical protein